MHLLCLGSICKAFQEDLEDASAGLYLPDGLLVAAFAAQHSGMSVLH